MVDPRKVGNYQVSYCCEHLELSPSGNSGRQFWTVGQWAGIFIYLSSLLPYWVSDALRNISFFTLLACPAQSQSMLPNWKKAIRQRVTDILQSVEMKLEGRWLCSDSVCDMPSFFCWSVCVIRSLCILVCFFIFHSLLHFHSLWFVVKLDPTPTPNIGNPLKNKHLFVFLRCVWAYLFFN